MRPGSRRKYRFNRIGLAEEDFMMQTGLNWFEIGSSECENEHHCKLYTNQ